jgi:hypothetical protein
MGGGRRNRLGRRAAAGLALVLALGGAPAVGGHGLAAQEDGVVPEGLLLEGLAGVFREELTTGTITGPWAGLRLGYRRLFLTPVIGAAWAGTRLPDRGRGGADRSWFVLTAGAERDLLRRPVEVALSGGLGVGRRDDELESGLASSPHWTPVGTVGLTVRGPLAPRWGWRAGVRAVAEDFLDSAARTGEGSGRTHWTFTAGAWLTP